MSSFKILQVPMACGLLPVFIVSAEGMLHVLGLLSACMNTSMEAVTGSMVRTLFDPYAHSDVLRSAVPIC